MGFFFFLGHTVIDFHAFEILNMCRVLHKHLPDCPGQVKVRVGQAFWKTNKKQLPKSGKIKVYCGHTTFSTKNISFSLGASKMSLGQVLFIKFVLYLTKWVSGKVETSVAPWCDNWIEASRSYKSIDLKGKFPKTTMWIGWVESNFRNPSVKVWADLDNPFKRSDYAKLCMSPSLDGTLPEYVISQEDNSPLTLYIDFHNFNFSWISIGLLIKFNHKCMNIHLRPNIPTCKYKRRGKMHFHEKWNFVQICVLFH